MEQQAVVGERMTGSIEPADCTAGAADAGGRTIEDMTVLVDEREGGL
jgi:hypothetical protein